MACPLSCPSGLRSRAGHEPARAAAAAPASSPPARGPGDTIKKIRFADHHQRTSRLPPAKPVLPGTKCRPGTGTQMSPRYPNLTVSLGFGADGKLIRPSAASVDGRAAAPAGTGSSRWCAPTAPACSRARTCDSSPTDRDLLDGHALRTMQTAGGFVDLAAPRVEFAIWMTFGAAMGNARRAGTRRWWRSGGIW